MTMLPTFLAGANYVMHSAGWLEAGPGVLLREVHRRHRAPAPCSSTSSRRWRSTRRASPSAPTRRSAPGGHFLGAAHTLERFRECFYRPLLSSTENFERWKRNGGLDAAARAEVIWKRTLEEYEQPPLDEAIRAELQEYVDRRRTELGD